MGLHKGDFEIIPERTVSFTGHRSFKIDTEPDLFADGPPDRGEIISRTGEVIRRLAEEGYDTFLCGMAEGFDLAAARAVLDSGRNLGLKLIAVVPYRGQSRGLSDEDRELYQEALMGAERVVVISEEYRSDCFHLRNDFLVDNSSALVCYYNGSAGGTAYTVKRALRKGLRVINIFNC